MKQIFRMIRVAAILLGGMLLTSVCGCREDADVNLNYGLTCSENFISIFEPRLLFTVEGQGGEETFLSASQMTWTTGFEPGYMPDYVYSWYTSKRYVITAPEVVTNTLKVTFSLRDNFELSDWEGKEISLAVCPYFECKAGPTHSVINYREKDKDGDDANFNIVIPADRDEDDLLACIRSIVDRVWTIDNIISIEKK